MIDPIDAALNKLRTATIDRDLDRLESAVFSHIGNQTRSDVFGGKVFQVQLAVSCVALILGLVMAEVAQDRMPIWLSETAVLSDDSGLAPSIRLTGGI